MKEIQIMVALVAMVTQVESLNCSDSLQVQCLSNQSDCREILSATKDQIYDGYKVCSSDPEAEFCVQITASVQSRPGFTKPVKARIVEATCSTKKSIKPACITRKDLPDDSSKIGQIIENATLTLELVEVCYSKGGFGTHVTVFVILPPLFLTLQYFSIIFTVDYLSIK